MTFKIRNKIFGQMNSLFVRSKYVLPPERFRRFYQNSCCKKKSFNLLTEHEKARNVQRMFPNNKNDKIGDISGLRLV